MKTLTPHTLMCAPLECHDGQQITVYAIVLEAPTLLAPSTQAADWMNTHPVYRSLAFSHALETYLEPVASLADPHPYTVSPDVLLDRPPTRGQEQESPDLPSREALFWENEQNHHETAFLS